ncbi:MAG TPA: UDP-3-O-acyl-N-acetylglucosamine deacetylase [Candidatus Polarisedimenticolia bacterium]|nr:UDP-3-O-acyl-N-acetylglucosamine deacetylase [Candidatus Polarisedimenticolia bacterium]
MVETQRTLARPVEAEGIGLHTGVRASVRLLPASADSGLVFVRRDRGGVEIPAAHRFLNATSLATTLSRGSSVVGTVEHLLSALQGLGIDNARLEVDGPELPILDGSAAPFVDLILAAGRRSLARPRRYITLKRPVSVMHGDRQIIALPANDLQVTYAIDFPHPVIGYQAVSAAIGEETYVSGIAPARTFCLLSDVEAMRRAGLALGGSLENAVVIGENGVLNDSLRYPDECARHKILDLVGDLALVGAPLRAHVVAIKGGHRLHAALIGALLASRSSWSLGTSDERVPAARLAEYAHLREKLVPGGVALTA